MSKTNLKSILVFAGIALALYLAFAFSNWTISPKKWGVDARAGYCMLTFIFGLFCVAKYNDLNDDNE